jgi:hypothetical protein
MEKETRPVKEKTSSTDWTEKDVVDAAQLFMFAEQLRIPQLDEEACESLAEVISGFPFGALVRAGLMSITRDPEKKIWLLSLSPEGQERFESWRKRGLQ